MKFNRQDRKITIQNFSTATNSYGEEVRTWGTFLEVYAELQNIGSIGGSESQEQARETATRRLNFFIRWYTGITEDMRIVYDGNNYDIISIHEIGRREGLRIHAEYKY